MRGWDEEGEKRGDEEDTATAAAERGGAMGGRRGRSCASGCVFLRSSRRGFG